MGIKKEKKLKTDLSSTTIIENNSDSLTSSTIIENKSERITSTIIKSKIDITSTSTSSSTIIRTESNGSTIEANPLLSLANYLVPQIQRPNTVNCTLSKKLRI